MAFIKRKIRGLTLKIFNYIENNGNADFYKNGESEFIDNLFSSFNERNKQEVVIFDVGSNVGKYSEMMNDKSNEIILNLHLFEPTEQCFSIISNKFKKNPNIVLNNFGASDSDGVATIYYDKEQSGLASLYQRNLDSYGLILDKSEGITLRRLDGYIEESNIQHIEFIKIDIEGHELRAFEGFGKYLDGDFIDYIQFEYGGANLDSRTSLMEIYHFLSCKGFSVAKIMPGGLDIREYSPFMDNFQYSNYVAISKNHT